MKTHYGDPQFVAALTTAILRSSNDRPCFLRHDDAQLQWHVSDHIQTATTPDGFVCRGPHITEYAGGRVVRYGTFAITQWSTEWSDERA